MAASNVDVPEYPWDFDSELRRTWLMVSEDGTRAVFYSRSQFEDALPGDGEPDVHVVELVVLRGGVSPDEPGAPRKRSRRRR